MRMSKAGRAADTEQSDREYIAASQQKARWGNVIKSAIALAAKKGLVVKSSQFTGWWSITLPDGHAHTAKSDSDMVKYVRGY